MRVVEILMLSIKVIHYLRFHPSISHLIILWTKIVTDIRNFTLFFILFVFIFGLIAKVLETEGFDDSPEAFKYVIYAWRVSMGGDISPKYEAWSGLIEAGEGGEIGAKVVICIIWLAWWLNQYVMVIIMLNFLIAIISQSYEEVMSKTSLSVYTQKCQMNTEYAILKRSLPWLFEKKEPS